MMEKLMLHLQYECQRKGILLPWDKAVHRLSPGSSGTAAQQHINKIRDILIGEGHMVPPLIGKLGSAQSSHVRGYIRDEDSSDPSQAKVVNWGEVVEDRKESLMIPGIIRGSGAYRKVEVEVKKHADHVLETAIKTEKVEKKALNLTSYKHKPMRGTDGTVHRRLRTIYPILEEEKTEPVGAGKTIMAKKPTAARKLRSSRQARVRDKVDQAEDHGVDPAELESDDDYNPGATKKSRAATRRTRRKRATKFTYRSDSSTAVDSENEEPQKQQTNDKQPATPTKTGWKKPASAAFMTPPATSKLVKLQSHSEYPDQSSFCVSGDKPLQSMIDGSIKRASTPEVLLTEMSPNLIPNTAP
jgi:hypothetical protein